MATKRDYERVAEAVRSVALEVHWAPKPLDGEHVLKQVVDALATAFANERSAFDKGRFIRACQAVK